MNLKKGFLIPPLPLSNFETQTYYQTESKFSGVYSRDNLPDEVEKLGICNKSWWVFWY